jgi:excisionase family DNA binding protein
MTESTLTVAAPVGPPGRLLTAEELAERWRVPKAQVYRLSREGCLPAVRIGRYYRYRLPAVEQWERDGGGAAND